MRAVTTMASERDIFRPKVAKCAGSYVAPPAWVATRLLVVKLGGRPGPKRNSTTAPMTNRNPPNRKLSGFVVASSASSTFSPKPYRPPFVSMPRYVRLSLSSSSSAAALSSRLKLSASGSTSPDEDDVSGGSCSAAPATMPTRESVSGTTFGNRPRLLDDLIVDGRGGDAAIAPALVQRAEADPANTIARVAIICELGYRSKASP